SSGSFRVARFGRSIQENQTLENQREKLLSRAFCRTIDVSTNSLTISPLYGGRGEKSCSNCQTSFICGPTEGKQSCWCEELPHVSLVADAEHDCPCPRCLAKAIANLPLVRDEMPKRSNPSGEQIDFVPPLVEGEDYYCEGPTIVFTAHYLLR